MHFRFGWEVFAMGSAFFAGLTALFGKLGVAGLNSNFATLIRTFVIIGVTVVIIWLRDEWVEPAAISRKTWIFLILSGIATGLSWLCYYRALQLGPVSKVAPVDKLSVAFAILLGLAFAGESLTWPVAVGGALIIAGSVIIISF
jgi:bacterial/archaeal transporter family protein